MEKKVNELIEESCFANDRGEFPLVSYTVLLYTKNQTVSVDTRYKSVLFSFLRCSETALNFQKWFFYVSNAEGSISILLTFILKYIFLVLSLN